VNTEFAIAEPNNVY